ncbi:heavy metal-binding domain-containing protein [Pediococcus argentinicus]|uniref:heavy metal-binding domain-containing protein n=1 Tax=Pediococcus argentinicus TaxID=480391 RepID=UPI00338E6E10
MFMTTEGLSVGHTIKGVVESTAHLMLASEDIDKFNMFDQLFEEAKAKLERKAKVLDGDGIIGLRFNTEIAEMQVAPKFLVVHAYGTVVKIDQ